jgi:hypothetical protein
LCGTGEARVARRRISMITLVIIVLLVVSILLSKSNPRAAGTLDLVVGCLLLFFKVIPGTAGILDWIFMFLFFVGGTALFFSRRVKSLA